MASPREKLAQSLAVLQALESRGVKAIRAKDLSRTHRERLSSNGFLQRVMKGWYIRSKPDDPSGESTAWYMTFWDFCTAYLTFRFGDAWCLSPEQSLAIHAGNFAVPKQLLVRAPRARNNVTQLLHGTSILETRAALPHAQHRATVDGLRVFAVHAALVECGPRCYRHNTTDIRAVLAQLRSASEVLAPLLGGGHSVVAGRLAGALRDLGRDRIADDIVQTMRSAGYDVRESNPFQRPTGAALSTDEARSPYVDRIRLLWEAMRGPVVATFPRSPGLPQDTRDYLDAVDEVFVNDAYHSLSIEGYRVTRELIDRIRSGVWDPQRRDSDRERRDALAAKGYHQAFALVKKSLDRVLAGANAGRIADDDHGGWYRALFGPSVQAGLAQAAELAGYRNAPVYIKGSRHIPPRAEMVPDCMRALFGLLIDEPDAAVRAVLGHFVFVYIHPYQDGNGRLARFLMNVMLASGGYPWTIVPVERRDDYVQALEVASVDEDIGSFAALVGELVEGGSPPREAEHELR